MEIHIKGAKKSQLMLQDTFTILLKKKKKSLSLYLSLSITEGPVKALLRFRWCHKVSLRLIKDFSKKQTKKYFILMTSGQYGA